MHVRRSTKRLGRWIVLAACVATTSTASAEPEKGLLQFHVTHNLETDACLTPQDCQLEFEDFADPTGWLARIRDYSDLAVLHWDRAIPWFVFDLEPPPGASRVAFYEPSLDRATVAWLDAFEAHFAILGRGFLAVSILSGERDHYAGVATDLQNGIEFPGTCPDFTPGVVASIDRGNGLESFDVERSYRNFVLYLAEKVEPDYLGLLVEANLVEVTCPSRAAGLYALYRNLHDDVRAELGPGPLLFATVSYPPLLGYDADACYPTSSFSACTQPPPAPAPDAGVAACYPVDRNAIDELELGGRLDLLALSFYPDGMQVDPLGSESLETTAFLLDDWENGNACTSRQTWPVPVDPFAALDRLGWTGPVAIAETSARSCVSPLRFDLPIGVGGALEPLVLEVGGSPASQAAWLDDLFGWARARDFAFVNLSFLRDYAPIGPWVVEQNLISMPVQQLMNTWPCSGLEDASGTPKPELVAIGLPEPGAAAQSAAALLALLVVAHRARVASR